MTPQPKSHDSARAPTGDAALTQRAPCPEPYARPELVRLKLQDTASDAGGQNHGDTLLDYITGGG